MSLARRVTLLFAGLLGVIVVLGALVVADVLDQRRAQREVTRLLDASLIASHRIALGQAELADSLAALVESDDPRLRADVEAQLAGQAAQAGALVSGTRGDRALGALATPVQEAIAGAQAEVVRPILAAVADGGVDRARTLLASERTRDANATVRAAIDAMYTGLEERRRAVDTALEAAWRTLLIGVLVTVVCLAVAWIAVVRILHRGVLGPISDVRSSMRAAARDRTRPIDAVGPAEVASLAADAEGMRRELVRQIDEAEAARDALRRGAPLVVELREAMRPVLADADWLRIHGTGRPGEGVLAGDWWDAIERPDGSIAIVVGDVSGHGVSSATAAVQVRAVLLAELASGTEPGPAVALAGRVLSASEHITTLVILIVDRDGMRWVNAGHPAPIIVRPDLGTHRCTPTGPLLSRLASTWSEERTAFPPGSVLIAFTDGLIEPLDDAGAELDEGVLIDWVRHEPQATRADPHELAERIVARARHRASALADDVTLLCIARPLD